MTTASRKLRLAQIVITALAVVLILVVGALSSALLGFGSSCINDADPSDCGHVVGNVLVPGAASALAGVAAIVACRLSRRPSQAWVLGLVLLVAGVALYPVLFFTW